MSEIKSNRHQLRLRLEELNSGAITIDSTETLVEALSPEPETEYDPMTMRLIDIEVFVKVNDCKQITNPISLETQGRATANGLFSTEIFGRPGSDQRKKTWAYIDLVNTFIHPLIYKTLCQLDRKFPQFISGDRRLGVSPNGELVEFVKGCKPIDDINDLKNHWSDIKWRKNKKFGNSKNSRYELLSSSPAKDIFITKWPVMPAGFRDVDLSVRAKEIPPINNDYVKLMTIAPPSSSGIDFYNGARTYKAQEALLSIFELSLGLVAKKNGIIQDQLLGRYVDYSTRGVISGPNLGKAQRPEDIQVPYGYLGVPLYLLLNLFYPFIIREGMGLLQYYTNVESGVSIFNPTTKRYERTALPKEVRASISPAIIEKWVTRFLRNQSDRLAPLAIEDHHGKLFYITLLNEFLPNGRQATLTDFFMLVAEKAVIIPDLTIYYTRYPITEFNSSNFGRVKILTTENTITIKYPQSELFPEEIIIKDYPDLSDMNKAVWLDSFILHGANTSAMSADFDGDTIRVIGIYTQEANSEAHRIMNSPAQFIGTKGGCSRPLSNEGVLTLYCLTA